jgi:prepilin-type N-terminal cleavage/methylation domain-containing protein
MNVTKQRGFTLWELMVAVAVAGIVLGFGVPSFTEFVRNNAMTSAANDVVGGVLLARAEAVKRQVPVALLFNADGSFTVFADDNGDDVADATDGNAVLNTGEPVILQRDKPRDGINFWIEGGDYISYGPNGFKRHATGQADDSATNLLYCDARGNVDRGGISTARVVNIDATGRAQVRTSPDDVSTAVTAIAGADCP